MSEAQLRIPYQRPVRHQDEKYRTLKKPQTSDSVSKRKYEVIKLYFEASLKKI